MANEKRLIDANEVLEVLCNYCPPNVPCPVGGCAEYQRIRKMLTADAVEVVHGRWILSDDECDCTCSMCNTAFDNIVYSILDDFNYCPNCGANMMGGDGNG